MGINSKADSIRGLLLMEGLISKQTRLEQCKNVLLSKYNGIVPFSNDTCVFAVVQGNEDKQAIYYNNKIVKNAVTDLSGVDIFKVIIDPEYFEKVLHSTYPNDFSDIEFIEVLVVDKPL